MTLFDTQKDLKCNSSQPQSNASAFRPVKNGTLDRCVWQCGVGVGDGKRSRYICAYLCETLCGSEFSFFLIQALVLDLDTCKGGCLDIFRFVQNGLS